MTQALLTSWDFRLVVFICLVVPALLYVRGWRYLRKVTRSSHNGQRAHSRTDLAAGWKLATYLGGLTTIAISLMSPIDVLSGQLFFMHMTQHLLLTMVAVPLMLIPNPFPVLVWGLPKRARPRVSGLLSEHSRFRRLFAKVTSPGIVWLLYVCALIGWHDPILYNLSLRNQFVHDLQHLSFFLTTALLWWHILGVAPRLHRTMTAGQRIIYTISVVPVSMIIGVVIAFASTPIYSHYVNVPRLMNLSVMQDQMIAGILMWIPGSEMFFWAALIVLTRVAGAEARKPVHPAAPWLVDDNAAASAQ